MSARQSTERDRRGIDYCSCDINTACPVHRTTVATEPRSEHMAREREIKAEALREAADDALTMYDPPINECIEWSEWLRARADRMTTPPGSERGGDA